MIQVAIQRKSELMNNELNKNKKSAIQSNSARKE